jgi:hypothetical protein
MHHTEKRLVTRIAVPQLPPNVLTLIADGREFKLDGLRDISESGIRCELSQSFPVSASVAIQYKDSNVQLAVHGRVAWCKKSSNAEQTGRTEESYMMGVELLSPMILLAVMPQGHSGN